MAFSVLSPTFKSSFFHPFKKNIEVVQSQGFETLYKNNGEYIFPANLWLNYLVNVKKVKDSGPAIRALKCYWNFLEANELEWNEFPPHKSLKPTYLFKNNYLLKKAKIGELKFSTASLYMSKIIQFYSWLIHEKLLKVGRDSAPFEFELVKVNPSNGGGFFRSSFIVRSTDLRIKVPRLSEQQSLNPLTENELKAYLKILSSSPIEFQIHQLLQLQTGLRIEEACTFPVSLVYLPKESTKRIEVEIGPHVGVHTKFGGIRKVEVTPFLMKLMYRYLISERRERSVSKSSTFVFEPLLFNTRGKLYSSANVQKYFGDLRAKIRTDFDMQFDHRTHDLRATYGTFRLSSLLKRGVNPVDAMTLLMGWLGHSNEKTTWQYLTFLEKQKLNVDVLCILDSIVEEAMSTI